MITLTVNYANPRKAAFNGPSMYMSRNGCSPEQTRFSLARELIKTFMFLWSRFLPSVATWIERGEKKKKKETHETLVLECFLASIINTRDVRSFIFFLFFSPLAILISLFIIIFKRDKYR